MEDIQRNFEFTYIDLGEDHADYDILDKPERILKQMGGIEILSLNENGEDAVGDNLCRQFAYELKMFDFSKAGISLKACLTTERNPEDHGDCVVGYITRVRLLGYDLGRDASSLRKISKALTGIPESNL